MGNKNSNKRPLNILQIPIYAIASYRNYVFLGGGGGYEIENQIEVYELENPSQKILKKIVHVEQTGQLCPNYFDLANKGVNLLATCQLSFVVFYKIETETGKLLKLIEFEADFKKEEASVNCCKFSKDNMMFATGGDDFLVRVFRVSPDFKKADLFLTLPGHFEPVNSVDISPNNELLVSSSTDKSCLIFNLQKKGQRIQKLTFSDGIDTKNMLMRGCFFSNDGKQVYCLATNNRQKSYLVQYQNKGNYEPLNVTVVHNNTSTGMKVSENGEQIGIMTSDGWVKVINRNDPGKFIVSQKRHRLPVTCIGFKHNFGGEAEIVLSGSADYTYNLIQCQESFIKWVLLWILKLAFIFGILLFAAGYL